MAKGDQPTTNYCKRKFFEGFWSRNMSCLTYQKSPKIRVGKVDEKRVFLEPYTVQLGNEVTCVLPVALLEFNVTCSMG